MQQPLCFWPVLNRAHTTSIATEQDEISRATPLERAGVHFGTTAEQVDATAVGELELKGFFARTIATYEIHWL